MTDIPEYDDLKLRIEPGDGDSYRVVAFGPGGNTASGAFARPISQVELDNFILRVGLPRRHVRKYRSSQMEEAKQLGTQLFESLLAEDVGDLYHGARSVADSQNRGLRLTLYLTGAPELMEIPWEFLYDPGDAFFLSQSMYTPLVRSLDLRSASPPRKLTLPMKVLAMASAPQGFPGLDVNDLGISSRVDVMIRLNPSRYGEWPSTSIASPWRQFASGVTVSRLSYAGLGAGGAGVVERGP